MLNRLLCAVALAILLAPGTGGLAAQPSWPRTADGHPDLQGFWQARGRADQGLESEFVVGGTIPYLPAAAGKRAAKRAARLAEDPLEQCFIPGVPRAMGLAWPFQILQAKDHVAMLFAWTLNYRLIFTDAGQHDTPFTPFMGYASGKWEGDTFVVDVTGLNDRTWLDQTGTWHSDALHVVERYTLVGRDKIRYEARVEDPQVFARPWTMRLTLARRKDLDRVPEFHCQAEKEERAGDFEREPRTWYPGPQAAVKALAFTPPVHTHRASTAPATVRRTADGRPDLSGAWEAENRGANFGIEAHPKVGLMPPGRGIVTDPPDGKLPLLPWAREELAARNSSLRGYDDPTAHCFPAGVPRAMWVPAPFYIVQTPHTVATLHERMAWRAIALNRTRHIPDATRYWQGDSLGHWDGDTLVVETTNLNGKTWGSEAGDVFSYARTVVERFTPVNANAMAYEATITDPLVYTRPFTVGYALTRLKGEFLEQACREEDRDLPILKRIRDQERARLKGAPPAPPPR